MPKSELKNLLIELQKLQKSKNGKNILKESLNTTINLSDIAEEILKEYRLPSNFEPLPDVASIRNQTKFGHLGGRWNITRGESKGDYDERVKKADYRLGALIDYIKKEVGESWRDMLKIDAVNNLDDATKKQIIEVMIKKLELVGKEMLRVLSVYPFEWEIGEDPEIDAKLKNL